MSRINESESSESSDDIVFKEYRELGSKSPSLEQYIVVVIHLTGAILISAIQFNDGVSVWFLGFGIVVPILLIIHGVGYSVFKNDSWYREQMIPFILSIVMATEIETDRFLQYHRWSTRFFLILGWPVILLCQMTWTFGLTEILPAFSADNVLTLIIGEFVAYLVIFGPFVLYGLALIFIFVILARLLQSRYEDIMHLFDIERMWNTERQRRAKNPPAS